MHGFKKKCVLLFFRYKLILDAIFKARGSSDFIQQLQIFVEACKYFKCSFMFQLL